MQKRIKEIRRKLGAGHFDCLVITKPANVTYVTGFLGDDSCAIIGKAGVWLITDSRYTEQAAGECKGCKIIERKKPLAEAVGRLIKKIKSVQTVAIENSISIAAFAALKKNIEVKVKSAADVIETVRSCKDAGEIAAIKTAGKIAAQAFERTIKIIKPGMTENELAGMLDFQIRKSGAKNSFETIVAFGANGSRPHHQPGKKRLRKNDSVLIDWGVRYKGYCSDLTRCFAVGGESSLFKKVYSAVTEAQRTAIKMIKNGVEISKIDTVARAVIKKYGLPVYGHGTGHGLGLEVHEGPTVAKKISGKLKAGMVLTVEPGVYIPGKIGVRIEDDVVVTEDGCRVLTSVKSGK